MNWLKSITVAAALVSAIGITGAHAADLFQTPAYEPSAEAPAELGTGWYLRGDVGADFGNQHASANVAGYGIVPTRLSNSRSVGLGVGYKFNSFVRADITGDWFTRQDMAASQASTTFPAGTTCATFVAGGVAPCTLSEGLQRRSAVELANLYFDLGTWSGLTPYVGAGAGMVQNRTRDGYITYTSNTGTGTVLGTIGGRSNQFAWAAMAGLAYALTPSATIDVGYRRLDLNSIETASSAVITAGAVKASGSSSRHVIENEVRVGFRYTP